MINLFNHHIWNRETGKRHCCGLEVLFTPTPPPPNYMMLWFHPHSFLSFMHVRFFLNLCTPFYWDSFICHQCMFSYVLFSPLFFFPVNVCPREVKKKGGGVRLCMFIAHNISSNLKKKLKENRKLVLASTAK